MRYPKPQKGNPHKLTIDQHIFPKASIARFTNDSGFVHVLKKNGEKDLWLRPGNSYFCARRLWDQKAESVFMRDIEHRYQKVAENIIAGGVTKLDDSMNSAVTDMYLLWCLRHERFLNPLPDIRLKMVDQEREISIDTQEILEANGNMFVSPDNSIASRFLTGISIMFDMGREREQMADKKWGIVKSTHAEFLVPDNFAALSVLPLSPTILLMAGYENQEIGFHHVADINGQAIHSSSRFYFARDFSACPILKHRILDGLYKKTDIIGRLT
jgi:hypothetical protein